MCSCRAIYLSAANVDQYYPGKDTVSIKTPPGGVQFSTSPKQSLQG